MTATTTTIAAANAVDRLDIASEGTTAGYDRALFEHWTDADGDGCDTRREVLIRQSETTVAPGPGCTIAAGTGQWASLYDGYSTDNPDELEIDHVVALAEAWRSGADGWNNEQRAEFANDLDAPELIAVTAASNRSKADRDPASWQPPNRAAWCEFASSWVEVKLRWHLTADPAEVTALRNMLRGCPSQPTS